MARYQRFFSDRRAFVAGLAGLAGTALLDGCGDPGVVYSTVPATPYDINHVLVTGQSLATGDQSLPVLTKSQPFTNMMFSASRMQFPGVDGEVDGSTNISLVPLTATQTNNPGANDYETLGNGFADTVIAATPTTMQQYPQVPAAKSILVSCSGIPGFVYLQLCGPTDWNSSNPYWASLGGGTNGSPSYREMMAQVTAAMAIAAAQNKTYNIPCVVVIHGEFDDYNAAYLQNLITWQKDVQAGIQAITKQTGTIPMILAQTCPGSMTAGTSPTAQLQAATQYSDKFILAGPEYQIPHNVADPTHLTIHLPARGQRMLGAMVSRAFRQVFLEGKTWFPLMPLDVKISGTQVVIDYTVPVAPIVLDTTWCTDPGNYGFTYSDGGGATIASVAVTGPTQVTLTLNKSSVSSNRYVGYASPDLAPDYGPINGTRGCLRDSATTAGYYDAVDGVPPQNYSVRWGGTY